MGDVLLSARERFSSSRRSFALVTPWVPPACSYFSISLHSRRLLEEDLGRAQALAVARGLVVFLKRPGGQAQFSAALSLQTVDDHRFAFDADRDRRIASIVLIRGAPSAWFMARSRRGRMRSGFSDPDVNSRTGNKFLSFRVSGLTSTMIRSARCSGTAELAGISPAPTEKGSG